MTKVFISSRTVKIQSILDVNNILDDSQRQKNHEAI